MEISRSHLSPNFDDRSTRISALVLHYTGMESSALALSRLCAQGLVAPVSAHYVIGEDGQVFGLVEERYRAWHAGVSVWRAREGLNDCSIGVELVNRGHEFGYHAFSDQQMASLLILARRIVDEYNISPCWLLGHSDIAVDRKRDPGELFDWGYLARGGVGFVPAAVDIIADAMAIDMDRDRDYYRSALDELLTRIGYDRCGENRVAAFQRRYRRSRVDNVADVECVVLARAVLRGWGE